MSTSVGFVRAAGDHYAIGRSHGRSRASSLRTFLDDGLARLAHLMPTAVSMETIAATFGDYRAAIGAATPGLAEEIRGLADGAGIKPDEALLLQLRREIVGYSKMPSASGRGSGVSSAAECTAYARVGPSVLAQTVDLNGNLEDQICVLDVAPTPGRHRSLVLSFGGLLGFLGLNSAGLAVGINLVLGGDWRPGLPPYLATRHLLDTAASVDEAIRILRGLRLTSSRCITLCDREKAAWVEVVGDDVRVVEASQTVHTNHLLHPDLADHDEINVFARNSSVRRLEACRNALSALPTTGDAEAHLALLARPPINVADDGDIRRDKTVAAVVMMPERGELHLRPGDPSRTHTRVFRLT